MVTERVKTVDMAQVALRFVTPSLLLILTVLANDYKGILSINTEQVGQLNVQMAVLLERDKAKDARLSIMEAKIDAGYKDMQNINNRLMILENRTSRK